MRVTIVGTGYVGLVSGACFSDFGHTVTCVDKDITKIERLRRREIPIYESRLDALVERNVEAGRLLFTSNLAEQAGVADVVMIAVGTPSRRGDGFADVSFVLDAAREIAAHLKPNAIVVTKSTVPVGTGDQVKAVIDELRQHGDIAVVSNPEFLREGAAIEDFKRPDRVVVGTEDEHARQVMRELYRPLFINETPILFTTRRTAELIKYASNAFLATKITFINEMANLCERVGADVQDVARGMGLDRRIGAKFLHAGPGFGGSCFPKDIAALAAMGMQHDTPMTIVDAVIKANVARRIAMAERIVNACGGSVAGKTLAVLGLSFKPNTDDMREAPSLAILPALRAKGATIRAYDPAGMDEARKHLPDVMMMANPYACMDGADALIILTEWDQFRALDFARVKAALRRHVIVDLRNIYRPADMAELGFDYVGVGRPRTAELPPLAATA